MTMRQMLWDESYVFTNLWSEFVSSVRTPSLWGVPLELVSSKKTYSSIMPNSHLIFVNECQHCRHEFCTNRGLFETSVSPSIHATIALGHVNDVIQPWFFTLIKPFLIS